MKPLTIVVSFDVGEQVVPGGIPGFVVTGGGVLAAAIGMVNEAWRRLLALDGHRHRGVGARPTEGVFLVKDRHR